MLKARGTITLQEIGPDTIRRTSPKHGEATGTLEAVGSPTYWLGQGYNVTVKLLDGRIIQRDWKPWSPSR
jgi:hypothetical protein